MTGARPSPTTGFLAGLVLWGLWAMSVSPLFALYFEFQCEQLEGCGKEWWYYARFYSHFFLYPATFGLISTVLLHRPWIRTVHHLCSLPARTRTMKVGLIVVSMLVVVGFMSYVEFSGSYSAIAYKNCGNTSEENGKFTGIVTAPWTIAPGAMKRSGEGMRIRSLLEQRCEGVEGSLNYSEKCEFQKKLVALWKDGDGPQSYTDRFYRVGFVTMTTLFALLFATIFVTHTRYSKNKEKDPNTRELDSTTALLTPALLFATFWVLMRIAHLRDATLTIYPEAPQLIFDWLIFLLFAAI